MSDIKLDRDTVAVIVMDLATDAKAAKAHKSSSDFWCKQWEQERKKAETYRSQLEAAGIEPNLVAFD